MEFEISVQRAEKHAATLQRVAAQMDRAIDQTLQDELRALLEWLTGEVKQRTPTDTGVLRNSIAPELRLSGTSLEGIISSPLIYSAPVEFGRKPGKQPPSEALRNWAQRKLGDANLAFVVARAIGRKGTPKHEMFQEAWDQNLGRITQLLDAMGVKVTEEILRELRR